MVDLAMPNVIDISPFRSYNSLNYIRPESSETQARNFAPQVLQAGDPSLDPKSPVSEVSPDEIGSRKIERIINDMVAAMRNSGASGLSAPQIGHPLQVLSLLSKSLRNHLPLNPQIIVIEDPKVFKQLVIINPRLRVLSPDETEESLEDCPSVRGYCAAVRRFRQVEVTGLNRRGEAVNLVAKGWLARALQHECDHLEGILYVDKMIPKTFKSM